MTQRLLGAQYIPIRSSLRFLVCLAIFPAQLHESGAQSWRNVMRGYAGLDGWASVGLATRWRHAEARWRDAGTCCREEVKLGSHWREIIHLIETQDLLADAMVTFFLLKIRIKRNVRTKRKNVTIFNVFGNYAARGSTSPGR